MGSAWWHRALQHRLGTLAATALIFWTIVTGIAATIAANRIAGGILAERQLQARGIATRLELTLRDDLRQLDLVAGASAPPVDDARLAAQIRGVRLAESVLRLSPDGVVRWARSVSDGRETTPIVPALRRGLEGRWHAEATEVMTTARGPRVFLVLPARESDPEGGAVAAAINPAATVLQPLVAAFGAAPYRVELLDDEGHEIAHGGAEVPVAAAGDLLVASAPVSNGRWLVRLVEPKADALAPVLMLRRILVGSSLLLLPFAVLVAVATARSIREPVMAMTDAAERLARGERAARILPAGEDEIGRLALALEQLRQALEGDERRSLLLKRVISAQEEERRRIARELHDQTTQQLTALALQLDALSAAHPAAVPDLARSHALVRSMIDDLHRVIYDLRPSVLDDLGLLPAIRSYADTHLASRGITVQCEFPDTMPTIPREATTALYRVVQEALTNIVRHSGAETVLIGCTVARDTLTIEVEDDGRGFDPERVGHPRETGEGLGLLGMRERLALLGASLKIESEMGRGTRVLITLPLGSQLERAA